MLVRFTQSHEPLLTLYGEPPREIEFTRDKTQPPTSVAPSQIEFTQNDSLLPLLQWFPEGENMQILLNADKEREEKERRREEIWRERIDNAVKGWENPTKKKKKLKKKRGAMKKKKP